MSEDLIVDLSRKLEELRANGLYKEERVLASAQGAQVSLSSSSPSAISGNAGASGTSAAGAGRSYKGENE